MIQVRFILKGKNGNCRRISDGSIQAGIYRVYACMISRLPEMPTNPVFSRVCGLLKKRQMYRNLSQIGVISHRNGVVNGVVDCS